MNKENITKELLSFLLKKYLDDNLKKLEENNLKENNILYSIKESTNNMKKILEESSKNIYKSNYKSNKTRIFEIKNKNKIVKTIYKKRNKMRNSVLINQNFTEKNKINIKNKFLNSTNKIESKYKKIFKNSLGYLSSKSMKKISNINSENRNKVINKNKTFIKKKSIINYTNKFNKLHLFKENNALDIKSYETTFVTPTTSEKQEMKLSHLCSSLLNLSQNDELLNNTLNNYEEKLESSIEYIIEYLSIKDLFNLVLINKEFYKIIIKYFIEKIEIKIGKIKEKINEIINKSKGYINIKEKEFKKIEKNIFNEREINLINLISTKKLFKSKSSLMNNKDIIFLFELFFISLGKKIDIIQFDSNDINIKIKRWNYFCKYFNNNENINLKNIIEKDLFNKKIKNEIINSLYEWSYKNIDKIKPNHFQIINKDIAIFAYIIKNILDYFGINKENKVNYQKLFTLYNIRLNVNEKINSKLNQMLIKFD